MVYFSGKDVTTAVVGDALVVVGTETGDAKVLTHEHNIENSDEVKRVLGDHPGEENIIQGGLLLGSLTSFRSFGNFR